MNVLVFKTIIKTNLGSLEALSCLYFAAGFERLCLHKFYMA